MGVVEGRVKKVDPVHRLAVVTTTEGKEVILHFDEQSYIEVPEPSSGGFMTGNLKYLKEGYWVEAKFDEKAGACHCSSLSCLS